MVPHFYLVTSHEILFNAYIEKHTWMKCGKYVIPDDQGWSLRFSQFSGCWLIFSVCIIMSFDFPL